MSSFKKVVLVCTSSPSLKNGHPTGLWLEELATPYYAFLEAGFECVIASTAGGPVPIDQGSVTGDFFTEDSKKFLHDPVAIGKLGHSVPLSSLSFPDCCDAVYLTGGHGCCEDFVDNATLKACIESMYAAGKATASDCHGVIALPQCESGGKPLVAGKKVTGFADTEEAAVQLTEAVPFLIEAKLKEQGGIFSKAADWNSHTVVDGNLITGQNPQSSKGTAEATVAFMKQ
eukprot:CAMPEP_0182499174 /NCGR_PEP_ID=MMETSP1321-20130603/7284_1 /TAXON_ID=91990 /ORGANISM="Bolidomonas sp., Strain RCC1657" /LENGTH=229 /DNA_ID=CAMNT_0024703325 /DNA_START=29 /DNA_END=718 /DNA_ORIENTATION=-